MEAALRREEKEREGSRRILGSPGGRRRCRFGRRSADGGGIDGGSGVGDSRRLGSIPSARNRRRTRRSFSARRWRLGRRGTPAMYGG
jgi:hypothetical protein